MINGVKTVRLKIVGNWYFERSSPTASFLHGFLRISKAFNSTLISASAGTEDRVITVFPRLYSGETGVILPETLTVISFAEEISSKTSFH